MFFNKCSDEKGTSSSGVGVIVGGRGVWVGVEVGKGVILGVQVADAVGVDVDRLSPSSTDGDASNTSSDRYKPEQDTIINVLMRISRKFRFFKKRVSIKIRQLIRLYRNLCIVESCTKIHNIKVK